MSVTCDGQWQFLLVCFTSCFFFNFFFSILLFGFAFHFSGFLNFTKQKHTHTNYSRVCLCFAVKLVCIPFGLSSSLIHFIILKKCALFLFFFSLFVWGLCDQIRLVQTPLIRICVRIKLCVVVLYKLAYANIRIWYLASHPSIVNLVIVVSVNVTI